MRGEQIGPSPSSAQVCVCCRLVALCLLVVTGSAASLPARAGDALTQQPVPRQLVLDGPHDAFEHSSARPGPALDDAPDAPVPPTLPPDSSRPNQATAKPPAGPYRLTFPLLYQGYQANACYSECCRFGFNVVGTSVMSFDIEKLGQVGWYQNWAYSKSPPQPHGIEYTQVVRLRDSQVDADYWPPDWGALARAVAHNRGAVWLIGNEPDVPSQDNCLPEEYAERYHECYTFIKSIDPSARVSAAGIVQPTELRLRWLDLVLQSYEARFGQKLPVDVWNIHVQILQERRGPSEWGCQVPPGIPDDAGEAHQIEDNANPQMFRDKIVQFRAWMRDRGERDKPLIISEYGVLMPSGYGYLGGADPELGDQMVRDFMSATFDFCRSATDTELGDPADGNRLVQRWAWYSLNDRMSDLVGEPPYFGFNGSLFEWDRPYPGALTQFGEHYRDYVAKLACDRHG